MKRSSPLRGPGGNGGAGSPRERGIPGDRPPGSYSILAAYRDGVTVICELARSLDKDYRPADPELVLAAWRGGLPQLWPEFPARSDSDDPWRLLLLASGRDPGWAGV